MDDNEAQTRLTVPVEPDDHTWGPAGAPVTLVEYGDFECPYCGLAEHTVQAIRRKYGDQIQFVFRNFPLLAHPFAQAAAEAAEFAADHGKFWEMHDVLYARSEALTESDLLGYAGELGLDPNDLASALREKTYAGIIEEVKEGGEASGIPGTPAFFLNDVLFEEEPTLENLSHAIDWLLEHPAVR